MTRERVDLWLDGTAAIEVAEAAAGAPGWPPLQRLVEGVAGTSAVALAEAQRDRDAGWPLDCYMYPVPRGRVERARGDLLADVDDKLDEDGEHETLLGGHGADNVRAAVHARVLADTGIDAALRGEAEALRRVAVRLARADRKAVAS